MHPVTKIVTISGGEDCIRLSVTTKEKVKIEPVGGETKVGLLIAGLFKTTVVPPVWVH